MPASPERSGPGHTTRPLMPTLSASNKGARPPLTPRLAGAGAGGGAGAGTGSPHPTISPALRRGNTADAHVSSPRIAATKEDVSTPVKAFLSSNVTPRSSSRKARAGSTSTTPNGTPNDTPSQSRPGSVGRGAVSSADVEAASRPKSVTSEGKSSDSVPRAGSPDRIAQPGAGRGRPIEHEPSRFFFASDAKGVSETPRPRPGHALGHSKSPSFFYANSPDGGQSQFFHANEVQQANAEDSIRTQRSESPKRQPMTPGSQVAGSFFPTFRPASPPKPASLNGSVPIPATVSTPGGNATPPMASLSSSKPINTKTPAPRRPSTDTSIRPRISHGRSISIGSIDPTHSQRSILASPAEVSSPLSISTTSHESKSSRDSREPGDLSPSTKTTVLASPLSLSSTTNPLVSPPAAHGPISPQAGGTALQQANEAAASARRERKVLDLEISNNSLLAINRTLEREMRKQHAELRRYRRLSRSGKLSLSLELKETKGGRRSISTARTSDFSGLESLPEDASSVDSTLTSSDENDDSGNEDFASDDEDASSPTATAESDARHARSDTRRLTMNLLKHQQLLKASSEMNHSLRRCLDFTDDLITSGKKALEHNVRVSDVKFGGRVLQPGDEEIDAG